jgi:hypothetical protein
MKQESVIEDYIADEDSILFEILLHPGDAPTCIWGNSEFRSESEVLIAASSRFMIESVESIDISIESESGMKEFTIPLVRLSYCMSWSDFDIDEPPTTIVLESESVIEEEVSISPSTAIASDWINSWIIPISDCKDKQTSETGKDDWMIDIDWSDMQKFSIEDLKWKTIGKYE